MKERKLTMLATALCAMCLTGCIASIRGGPPPLLPVDVVSQSDVESAAKALASGALDGSGNKTARNLKISLLVSAADAHFYVFRRKLLATARNSGAGSGALTLMMTIAGTLTGSPGVKQHYLVGTNLVNGLAGQYDRSYLHEKNVSALVATMEGDRSLQLIVLLNGMDDDNYRGQTALLDLYKYLAAGTVESAVESIERRAKANAEQNGSIASDPAKREALRQAATDELRGSAPENSQQNKYLRKGSVEKSRKKESSRNSGSR